jgi:hypothetical protein
MFPYALIKSGFAQEYAVAGYRWTRDHDEPLPEVHVDSLNLQDEESYYSL